MIFALILLTKFLACLPRNKAWILARAYFSSLVYLFLIRFEGRIGPPAKNDLNLLGSFFLQSSTISTL